jgi:predicted small secreted protein
MSRFAPAIAGRPQLVGLLILLIPALLAACTTPGGKGGY